MNGSFVVVYSASGRLEGEMVKMLLNSEGIPAEAIQESYGITLGLTVGKLGKADILVPAEYEQQARQIIEAMENGSLTSSGEDDDQPDRELPE